MWEIVGNFYRHIAHAAITDHFRMKSIEDPIFERIDEKFSD